MLQQMAMESILVADAGEEPSVRYLCSPETHPEKWRSPARPGNQTSALQLEIAGTVALQTLEHKNLGNSAAYSAVFDIFGRHVGVQQERQGNLERVLEGCSGFSYEAGGPYVCYIGPWHLGMLAALMALFDVFVGACEDEKAVFPETVWRHGFSPSSSV